MEQLLSMLEWIQTLRVPVLDQIFVWITVLGEEYFAIGVLCLILWCVSKELGYKIGFSYLTSWMLNFSVKEIFHVQRPFLLDKDIVPIRPETATGYSFPSGHTQSMSSLSTAVAAAFRKKWLYIAAPLLILLMALSRMYLGVHTLLDVAVGAVVGTGWVFAANWIFTAAAKRKRQVLLLLMLVPMAVGMIFVQTNDYYKIAGTFTSFIIGYLLDIRYIRYDVKGRPLQRVLKFLIGMVVLMVLKTALKPLLGESLAADYSRYLLLGFWITVFAPMLFRVLFKEKSNTTIG
jgi:membrane-associated phospholipid phosphatase